MAGTNAAVVGILAAALYQPIWASAVLSTTDFAVALSAFMVLTVWKAPPWLVVFATVALSLVLGRIAPSV
jgi:chromate transporter